MSKIKVLIVEDDRDFRELICEYFDNENFIVFETDNGDDAYEIATRVLPDVMLLDVMLPGKSGFDICREFKADDRLCAIPVIMLTGLMGMNDKLHGYISGAKHWLCKPCELEDVEQCLHRALRHQQARSRPVESSRQGFSSDRQQSLPFETPPYPDEPARE